MDNKFINITVSDPIYWGFKYIIPLDYAMNVTKDILVDEMKIYMKNFFGSHGLVYLQEGVDKLNLHLHDDIKYTDTVVYMCTHCSKLIQED